MKSRILMGLLAGALGGFLGWLLQESLINYNSLIIPSALPGQPPVEAPLTTQMVMIMMLCVGGLIGLFLGAVDGIVEGNKRKLLIGMLLGAPGGFLLGIIGLNLGNVLFNILGGRETLQTGLSPTGFLQQILARAFGWAPMGLGLGVGASLSTRSGKRIGQGALGGFLGGFAGGFVFDMASSLTAPAQTALSSRAIDVGGPGRAIGFTAIGAFTGLFMGLAQVLLKSAWVRLLAGRNEGRDISLDKSTSILGRDERCDVPLFGDMQVAVQHAAIQLKGSRRYLLDAGTPLGTLLNGQNLPARGEALLQDGDMIQIGSHRILFREKVSETASSRRSAEQLRSVSQAAPVQMPSHLCPYCGSAKDAYGNCQCTIAVQGVSSAQIPGGATSMYAPSAPVSAGGTLSSPAMGYQMQTQGRLTVQNGDKAGQVFLLQKENTTLGREASCDIVLANDPSVSRLHAYIAGGAAGFVLQDNQSANGTWVNGQRVSTWQLTAGDNIQMGQTMLLFE